MDASAGEPAAQHQAWPWLTGSIYARLAKLSTFTAVAPSLRVSTQVCCAGVCES